MSTQSAARQSEQLEQASLLLQQGQIQPAVKLCQSILAADETCAPAYGMMGDIPRRMGNYQSAEKFLDLALRFDAQNPSYHIQKAQTLFSIGKADAALATIEALIAQAPNFAVAHLLRGDFLIHLKRYDDAIASFNMVRLLEDMPGLGEHYGICYLQMGKLAEAEKHFKDTIARLPDYFRPYQTIGQIRLQQEDEAGAEEYFDKALALNAVDYQSWIGKGAIARTRKDDAQALACFQHAVQSNPSNYTVYYTLGAFLQQTKRLEEAEPFLRKAVELNPAFIPAQQELANSLYNRGKRTEALTHIEAVLREDPENSAFRHMRAGIVGETPENAPADYVSALFDGYAESFDHHLVEGLGYKTPTRIAEALERVMQEAGDTRRDLSLMDLGCGTGLGAEAFAPLTGWRGGVDLSAKMIEKAEIKGLYDQLTVSDVVEHLEHATRHYDLIAACDVLVYIGNLAPLLAASVSRLAPGGYIAVSVENGDDVAPYALRPSGRYAHAAQYLESLAKEHGLQVCCAQKSVIRTENHEPVEGYIVILRS